MSEPIGTVAGALGENLLWSEFGGSELVLALIVALVLLAFAFPARLSDRRPLERRANDGARTGHLSHR